MPRNHDESGHLRSHQSRSQKVQNENLAIRLEDSDLIALKLDLHMDVFADYLDEHSKRLVFGRDLNLLLARVGSRLFDEAFPASGFG